MQDVTTQTNNSISRLLDAFLPNDVLEIENAISEKGFSNEDFSFDCPNPEKRVIPELWVTHHETGYYFRSSFHDGLKLYQFRTKPGIYNPHQQHKYNANQKGPQFDNITIGFKSWLERIKFLIESRNKLSDKKGATSGPIKDNTVYEVSGIEIPTQENNEDEMLSGEVLNELNQFTNWLLPIAESQIGNTINQAQYESLRRDIEDLQAKVNSSPPAPKSMIGEALKKIMEHEVLMALSPYIHEYAVTPAWKIIKLIFGWLQ